MRHLLIACMLAGPVGAETCPEAPDHAEALSRLIADASRRRIAVMCSEALWWRCHRRFIADAAVLLHDMPVEHLMHDGRRHAHPPMPEARVVDGQLQYDR